MENGEICDRKISASSEYHSYHSANQGRLHFKATGDKGGTWVAGLPDTNQWLQVDLGTECFILTRVATQGGNRYWAWVRAYYLEFASNAARNFQYYRERGSKYGKVNCQIPPVIIIMLFTIKTSDDPFKSVNSDSNNVDVNKIHYLLKLP